PMNPNLDSVPDRIILVAHQPGARANGMPETPPGACACHGAGRGEVQRKAMAGVNARAPWYAPHGNPPQPPGSASVMDVLNGRSNPLVMRLSTSLATLLATLAPAWLCAQQL